MQTLGGASTYTGATTVASGKLNLTGSLASAVTVGNNASTVAILSGNGTINGALATATTGSNVAYIAPGVNTGGTRGDFGSAGTLHVGGSSFSVGAGTQFDFDLGSTAAGANDSIAMTGGTLAIGGTGIVFNFNQSGLQLNTAYTLVSGAGSITGFSSADFTAMGIGADTATFTENTAGTALQVTFLSSGGGATTGTYTLATTVGSSILHTGATTTATTTLTNTGSGAADSLDVTGLGAASTGGTVNNDTVDSSTAVAQTGTLSNTGQTFTASSLGNQTVTGTVTSVTGANGSGAATRAGNTGANVFVYSGVGVWNTAGGGAWGTTQTTTQSATNWAGGRGHAGRYQRVHHDGFGELRQYRLQRHGGGDVGRGEPVPQRDHV